MDHKTLTEWAVAVAVIGPAIWGVGRFLPGFITKKFHSALDAIRAGAWVRDPKKPHRAKWLLATLQMLEEEIPEPGEGRELYEALGNKIAASVPILSGTGKKWADALQKAGDALDTEIEADIKEMLDKGNLEP